MCVITSARAVATGIVEKVFASLITVKLSPWQLRFSFIGGKAAVFRKGIELVCKKHNSAWEDLPASCNAHYGKPDGK